MPGSIQKISKTKDNLKFLGSDETVKRDLAERLQTLERSAVFAMLVYKLALCLEGRNYS